MKKAQVGDADLGFSQVRRQGFELLIKGQLDLEQHGRRTFQGVAIRVARRILAPAAGVWHNNKTGAPITRSLIAFDH
jgi:hypothetical protein